MARFDTPPAAPVWVSDAFVDLLVQAGIDHVAFNPGATFRGIHDSLVNHRADAPRIVLCAHEAISVAVAHGYAKAAGRPMAVLLHDVVGLQHGAMAIYNAWVDRVPLLLIGGTGPLSTVKRRPWIDWIHTANVQAEQIRNYVKWDDQPADAASIPRAFARSLNFAVAEPPGPVYLCLDAGLQEDELDGAPWPSPGEFAPASPPAAAEHDLGELAQRLRTASRPVLITDYAGATREGHDALGALAELLHAPVIDRGARHNLAVGHELNYSELPAVVGEADLVVGFEVEDLHGALAPLRAQGEGDHRSPTVIHVAAGHLRVRSWAHDVGELPALHRLLTATAQTALPALMARCSDRPPAADVIAERRAWLGDRARRRHEELWAQARAAQADGAVAHPRLAAEAWAVLAPHDPLVVHSKTPDWERRLWPLTGFNAHLGWHGGGGLGYGLGASIGAALALADSGRLLVDLQPDGDLLYTPAALWTAAQLDTPLLILVQNNRQYRNTVEHGARIAQARGRPPENRYVGAGLADPPVDYAALARSFGVWSAGPIADPDQIAPALTDAVQIVRSGRPALVEVLTAGA